MSYHDACPGLHFEKMSKMLCCDRCAGHNVSRNDTRHRIANACREVEIARMSGRGLSPQVSAAIREKLERYTKTYTTLLCDHYRLANVWDSDFPEQLMDRPDKWGVILQLYEDGLRSFKTIPPSRTHADA